MPEDVVVKHCAPTLAGLKTGNLFMTSYDSEQHLDQEILRLNELLNDKGLKVTKLRVRKGRALIYVYRPGQLQADLNREEAKAILKRFGYTDIGHQVCIERLCDRICDSCDFPHEIGLFLGYPPEDVNGFIRHRGQKCKHVGHWKVYGDVGEAEKRFEMFNKCTGVYLRCLDKGVPFEKLAVRKNV